MRCGVGGPTFDGDAASGGGNWGTTVELEQVHLGVQRVAAEEASPTNTAMRG